jgi:hypothetical protein
MKYKFGSLLSFAVLVAMVTMVSRCMVVGHG